MKYRQTAYAISLFSGSPTLHLSRIQGFVGLLTFTFRRSYLILHQRTHLAFSPGHDSPSNDRLSPYADYPAQKRYFVITATKGACIFASMHLAAAPTCPGISPDSLVQQGTRMRVRSVIASSGRAFATKAILIFSLLQTKIDCLLRQSMHSRNIPAPRFCFRSVPLRKSPPL